MSEPERFEFLILGSGQGGKLLAWHLAQTGRRVAVVERRWIGGSCLNAACLPSKNEIWSVRVAHLVHNAAQFGLDTGPVKLDMAKVRQRNMVDGSVVAHLGNYRASGAQLIMGNGRFVAPKTLEVALVDESDDRILGFTMIGAEADGLFATMQIAILAKLPYPMVRDAIFAHPTMAEGLAALFANVPRAHAQRSIPGDLDVVS